MQTTQRRLLALIAANKDKPKRNEILNADGPEATVYLYDAIDAYYGVDAQTFVKDFNAITAPTIHLRINSPGGDVFDGRAIATAIAQHPSNVVAHVDGLAASAASYVAIAADSVEMAPGSFMMIHNAWTFAFGNSEDLLQTAALLEKIDGSLAADYAKKTGKTVAQIETLMSAETWFTAEEAVVEGFADSVAADDPEGIEDSWDLSAFMNAPKKNKTISTLVDASQIEAEAKKVADAAAATAAEEQANLDHADRTRRVAMLTAIA